MVCPSCAAPNPDEANVCEKCGKPLTQGFQIFPRLPVNAPHRLPAEPLNWLPFGVGGWLAILVISVIIFCPVRFSIRALAEFRLMHAAGFDLLAPVLYRGVDFVVCLVLAAGGIFTGWNLLGLNRNAKRIAEIYLLLVCGYYAIGYVLAFSSPSMCYLANGGTDFAPDQVLSSGIWAVLWFAYLRKSKRVANTYGIVSVSSPL